jgi:hypothetical protein
VRVGQPGEMAKRGSVSSFTFLPTESRPVFVSLGATSDGKTAIFGVSDEATVAGDGAGCLPRPSDCEYLALKEGDVARVTYGADPLTFKLALAGIDLVTVPAPGS